MTGHDQGYGSRPDDEDPRDQALLRELGEALRAVGPAVHGVAALGRGSLTWRTIDTELLTAALTFDSATAPAPATTRSAADGGRVLVFTAELRSVEVEVLSDRVVGQFVPASAGRVEVEGTAGILATHEVDELGFFVVEPVPRGVVRFRCATTTTRLVTDWVQL